MRLSKGRRRIRKQWEKGVKVPYGPKETRITHC